MKKKLFDYVIGNPPYQESREGTSDKQIYNYIMDAGFEVGKKQNLLLQQDFYLMQEILQNRGMKRCYKILILKY